MAERSYRGLLWTLALTGTVLDQVSKYGVFKWLFQSPGFRLDTEGRGRGVHDLVPGVFQFLAEFTGQRENSAGFLSPLRTLSGDALPKVNHGALFGLGGDYAQVANPVFAVVSVVAAVAIIVWSFRRSTTRDWSLCVALGLILAGTLGNLYDRIVFDGVRDFLYFYLIDWPVFNVADCCLVCGAFLLLTQAFWSRPVPEEQASATALVSEVANVH
jgi:lipoprotein signal peptidase